MKILLINGHEYWETSKGLLNETLVETSKVFFTKLGHEVMESKINDDFNVDEEIHKYLWANAIIYFTPVYWFDVPAKFKSYLEQVFSGGKTQLFVDDGVASNGQYGTGGLLNMTKYMLVTTWNAPEFAFNNSINSFLFDNKSADDVFLHFHAAQRFLGMKKMPGIHFYNVKRNPQIEKFKADLVKHLDFNFNFK